MTSYTFRRLEFAQDAALVRGLYDRAADYVALETGMPPNTALVADFFHSVPPGTDPAASVRLGLFADDRLVAVAEMSFGFPDPDDAYLGLMLFDAACRGQGLGQMFLDHLLALAAARGAPRVLLAVLDDNTRGRAFWERAGFRVVHTAAPAQMGRKWHVRHRMERRF